VDPLPEQNADFVNAHQLAGIGNCNRKPAISLFQRHEVVPEHQVNRYLAEQLRLEVGFTKIDKIAAIAAREFSSAGLFIASRDCRREDL